MLSFGRTLLALACVFACGTNPEQGHGMPANATEPVPRGGEARWFSVPDGRMKGRVYSSPRLTSHPLLMIVLHGDIPQPPPSYHYDFAQAAAEGFDSVVSLPKSIRAIFGSGPDIQDLVAAGLIRPGYADPSGDRSDGDMGYGIADNYTPRVVDDVAAAIHQLQTQYRPRATVVVGHSGGAAIMADLLGRHPDIANAALLVDCGCDPVKGRARWKAKQGDPIFDRPNPSLLPLEMAAFVSLKVKVRLIVGALDDNALPEYSDSYAQALRAHGVDASVEVLPGLKHDILFSPPAFKSLEQLLALY